MRNLLSLAAAAGLLVGLLALTNCSNPLDSPLDRIPTPPAQTDTVFVTDTLFRTDTVKVADSVVKTDTLVVSDTVVHLDTLVVSDTVIQMDTLVVRDTVVRTDTLVVSDTVVRSDTVVVHDTVLRVDTLVVYLPDTSGAQMLCAQLGAHRKSIAWLLANPGGRFALEFRARVERDMPPQHLIVEIDGKRYEWSPPAALSLTVEADLSPRATILIAPVQPKAFGHEIDICLNVRPL